MNDLQPKSSGMVTLTSLLTLIMFSCHSSLEVEVKKGAEIPSASAQLGTSTTTGSETVKATNSPPPEKSPEAGTTPDLKPELTGLDRLAARAGDTVKISGKNLGTQKDLEITIGAVRIPLSINPDGSAEFKMPEGISPGMGEIKLVSKTLGDLGQATMLADAGDFPIITMAVEEVCKDKKYRNAKGEILVGTKDCGSLPACSASVQVDCRLTSEFLSVPKTELVPTVIKSGAKVGGVTGTYPSIANPLTGADTTADLDSATFATKIKSAATFEFFGPDGTRYTLSGDPDLSATNLLSGVEIFGTTGTVATAPAICTANNVTGCVTTATYKSADWTNLSATNIKSGVSVAGLTGIYPSSGNVLTGADGTADLDLATFDAKVKSATAFEFFGPDGTRYSNSGDADITAANIASGVTIFGTTGTVPAPQCTSGVQVTCESDTACRWNTGACEINPWHIRAGITVASKAGSLKTNCRNTINSTYYNWDGAVASLINTGSTAGTAYDYWDTIDDYFGLAPNKVTAWSGNTLCDSSNWTDVTTTNGGSSFTTCGTSSTCIYRDELSGLRVTGILSSGNNTTNTASPATYTWSAAINACNDSTYGGYGAGTWRLPTQKEFMSLYQHGIGSVVGAGFHALVNIQNYYWSSTSNSTSTLTASNIYLGFGGTNTALRTNTWYALCVF